MVAGDDGQLYTIEGIAAGMIMLFTAYLVISATSIYTPGDTHISDMQLEQIGTDALRMMNTPVNGSVTKSPLQEIVETSNPSAGQNSEFNTLFLDYVNNRTGPIPDNLHYTAMVSYRNGSSTDSYPLAFNANLTGGEHPVRVTEWVIANIKLPGRPTVEPRAVLVEVILWRD